MDGLWHIVDDLQQIVDDFSRIVDDFSYCLVDAWPMSGDVCLMILNGRSIFLCFGNP